MLKRDEGGSIIIAVLIMFVLVTISSAMAYRVIGNQNLVVTRQNTSAGVAAADAGISDALFRLDQGSAYEGNGSEFYVKSTSMCSTDRRCVGQSIAGAPGVSYVARQLTSSKWVIESTGTVRGKVGAVQETVTRSQEYPFALFGNTSLTFNGNASVAFSTYNSSAVASSSNPNSGGDVAIGSNGTITCNGGLGSNVTAAYYGTGGIGSLSSSCGTPESFSYVYDLPTPTAPSPSLGCPDNGNLGSGISGASTVLSAGTYLCTVPVNISGLLEVSGPVSLYIILDPSTYGSSTNALTIARNSYVNDMSDYCAANSTASGCSPTPDLPISEDLQILTNSTGTVGNDNGQGYDFGGILYAPQASLTQDGCKSQYYGSLTINTLTCNGGPHLFVSYDSQLSSLYGAWTAGDYAVISPSSVTLP